MPLSVAILQTTCNEEGNKHAMTVLDLFALALAAGCIVDAWNNASLLANWRAYFEALKLSYDVGPPPFHEKEYPANTPAYERRTDRSLSSLAHYMSWITRERRLQWLVELLECDYCLSFWAALLPAAFFLLPALCLPSPWDQLLRLPIYVMAAYRITYLLNAALPEYMRYKRWMLEKDEEDDAEREPPADAGTAAAATAAPDV